MVNRERLIKEFITLAGFDSESFHEKDIADYLYQKLKELGLEVKRDDVGKKIHDNEKAAGNIYAYLKGNQKGEPVLFSAHMDTVAPGVGKKVIIHEDGKVTSDESTVLGADDITGIVAILEMLTVIKEDKLSHPDIEVVFFVAEESYAIGSSYFDYSLLKSKQAYVLDLDGPIGRIANEAPSIIQFEINVMGKSAHAGFEPEKGVSAIVLASKAIEKITLGRTDENTTVNIGTIHGGTGKNIIPGQVCLSGEVRSLNHQKAHAQIEKIRDAFTTVSDENGGKIAFECKEMIRAYQVNKDALVIQRYQSVYEKLGYGVATIVSTFGGSDNNNFCKHGIEGIVIANAMNNVHTLKEYFYVDELEKSSKILVGLASQYCE